MSTRITKAEARAAAIALESILAGSIADAEFVSDDEDPDLWANQLRSVTDKLWERAQR